MARSYLKLLKNTLTNTHYKKIDDSPLSERELRQSAEAVAKVRAKFGPLAEAGNLEVKGTLELFTPEVGAGWFRRNTWESHTLLESTGLANVEYCLRNILTRQVPGDLIECGVWRGGTCIYMRGLLKALGDSQRTVWVADSFQGLPDPDPSVSPLDAISHEFLKVIGAFSVSLEAVQANFKAYDLLDNQVRFLPGWFSDTLAQAPIEQLSLIRLDADYYDSTVQALDALYSKLSPGGYIIIDDYGIPTLGARRAVDEFRARHDIQQPLVGVDQSVVFWEKA
ncbi:class I SAM-dependent methyltransferase [bacterium]|nr:class I SAM-dependent methyltransferase [bacterium]